MNRLPQKTSLVAQTVSVLTEQIQGGRWTGRLPGEHALCAQLHVGRKTLRAALQQLEHQGWVACEQGLRRRILHRKSAPVVREVKRVVLLMPAALHSLNPFALFLIDKLREYLADEGLQLDTQVSRAAYKWRDPAGLEDLSKTLHPAGWVLMHSTEPMQRWFAARQLPCVVVGSRYRGIRLSSVDMDYEAVCTHSVGQFVSRGHKRLVLVNPEPAAAGDTRTEAGFLAAVARQNAAEITSTVIKHEGTAADICRQVSLARAQADAPTGFLVSRAHHFLTVMTFLLGRGTKIPEQVALISRENDLYLDSVVPEVTRYSQNPTAFASNASRMVMQMIRGNQRVEECRIMPNYIKGKTLG